MMKKRWLSLFVENDVGVLAKISGMFSGKNYNLESLTVGLTEDPTVSRITIGLNSNDEIFEQIKKQLNRSVGIIKVIDLTEKDIITKELLYIKINNCSDAQKEKAFLIATVFNAKIIDYGTDSILIETISTDQENADLVQLMKQFPSIEIIRSGIVAVEKCSK